MKRDIWRRVRVLWWRRAACYTLGAVSAGYLAYRLRRWEGGDHGGY